MSVLLTNAFKLQRRFAWSGQLIVFVDDHVFVKPGVLQSVAAAFEDPRVGICGVKKSVRRKVFQTGSILRDLWLAFWNFLGIAYLMRHNFETQATNAMDGGVFVISGRANGVRTESLQDEEFLDSFINDSIFGFPIRNRGRQLHHQLGDHPPRL